ncbi:DNA/RNA polymerases superfamily protein [Gossypium australe]|uniref:DNA/RNA polymerases superfamily protein n=1 Tax=Gossypium australe TaxID=47621 RepID=A0A5B6VAG3_9ROSI|nr:DNA/RNA polymerases superfamily protein [Gossypium australe]
MTYEVKLIHILAREVKELRNKKILLVKVLWHRHGIEEATWAPEESMRRQYPNLSRTEENGLRSRENKSNRVAVSVPVKPNSRSSKLLKSRGSSRIIITLLNLFWYFWNMYIARYGKYRLWKTLTSVVPKERLTWDFFQIEFRKKYINDRFIDQKRKEFLELK